jgi:hypothetical protein
MSLPKHSKRIHPLVIEEDCMQYVKIFSQDKTAGNICAAFVFITATLLKNAKRAAL